MQIHPQDGACYSQLSDETRSHMKWWECGNRSLVIWLHLRQCSLFQQWVNKGCKYGWCFCCPLLFFYGCGLLYYHFCAVKCIYSSCLNIQYCIYICLLYLTSIVVAQCFHLIKGIFEVIIFIFLSSLLKTTHKFYFYRAVLRQRVEVHHHLLISWSYLGLRLSKTGIRWPQLELSGDLPSD